MPASAETVRRVSRRLRDLVEPLAANVYFAPEAHKRYADLGLSFAPGYFCSRGACMGQVPGEVIAAAFGVFKAPMVKDNVDQGWSKTDAATILEARQAGAVESLERILGDDLDGAPRATELLRRAGDAALTETRMLHSGLRSLGWPGDPVGDLWRAADLVREHRGDSHNCAWVAAGASAIEIGLLTELWWRLPLNSYIRTRGWSDEEIQAGIESLASKGFIKDEQFTPEGEDYRGAIEAATDEGERRIVEALGDDADELFAILEPWAKAIVASGGYPSDPSQLTRQ
jgi:helix-turn-helix protein